MAKLIVSYGDDRIPYVVKRIEKRHGKIKIHVYPDGNVQVDAPVGCSERLIKEAVYKRARWVQAQLNTIRKQTQYALPRKYISGESHFYLGRQYVLKIKSRKTATPEVKLLRGRFQIITKDKSPDVIANLLQSWYREKANKVFNKRLTLLMPTMVWLKQELPPIKLREMKKQWGSCSPSGTIVLNPKLIKAPTACVDYVLLHELCHLRVHNHSPKFYRMLDKLMPDWRKTKEKLDNMAEQILVV